MEYNKDMSLTSEQQALLDYPIKSFVFLQGRAGTGKTTAATHWLKKLLDVGIPAHEILIFVPQRLLANPYQDILQEEVDLANSLVTTMTLGSLARRMVELFWPIISRQVGVSHPDLPPQFLTLETSQYYMAHIVHPLIEQDGYFESLTINRNRIYSQILDNLNKAAVVGFPHAEISERLKSAWVGDIDQLHVYDDVQNCIEKFRAFCLENNLLDFSLQVESFVKHLWHSPLCRQYLQRSYRHLIVDNIEEDTPLSHDILKDWLADFDSALILFDEDAGYRFFLGADVTSALSLKNGCEKTIRFEHSLVSQPGIEQLKLGMEKATARLQGGSGISQELSFEILRSALESPETNPKYFPAMVKWVSDRIEHLVKKENVPPEEIVVLAPFMPDVLRFSLSNQLHERGIPNQSHRPSRSLRDEPAAQTLLTLARAAYPSWDLIPKSINLAYALMHVIEGLDLVRSQLLIEHVYHQKEQEFPLRPFGEIPSDTRDRITYQMGQHYDRLRDWLEEASHQETVSLDFFLNRLFGEVLSQPGYGFHNDLDSGNTIARLIESIQKFRWAVHNPSAQGDFSIGMEYVQMVQDGVIAAQYVSTWQRQIGEAVFLSPAYTFLISNRPVDYQFWLDVGSPSWYQRLDQPLTQPYVLSRNWQQGEIWDAEDELSASHETLHRLTLGLLNRCRKKVFIGMSELDVRGYENRGLLIRVFQHILQSAQRGKA